MSVKPTFADFSTAWQAAPPLLFHIDRGEHSLPAQLGWRGEDGSESAVSFQSRMSDFHGCHRAADGTAYEYRGRLTGRWAYPEDLDEHPSASVPHRFRTEEGWGGSSPGSVSSAPPPARRSPAATSATTRVPPATAARRSPRSPIWRRPPRARP